MIIGHYAVGFAAKKWAPKVSLGTLIVAAIWLDLIWPVFVFFGLEHFNINPNADFTNKFLAFTFVDFPLSHSLVMALAWAACFGLVYFIFARDTIGSWIVAGLVASNWFLESIVHSHDLPLFPAAQDYMARRVGLGLWNSTPWTIVVEAALFTVGVILYYLVTQAKDFIGELAFWGLVTFMVGCYALNIVSPPPGDPKLASSVAELEWVVIFIWAYWVEGHRKKV